jgi:CheY-like chemotaxis protein
MKRILLIEDNEADQFLGQHVIQATRPGLEVQIASDGVEALEILSKMESEPDVILLDINMPRMDGHEFLKVFTNDNDREIPVVVMLTSSDQTLDKDRSMAYKCVKDYLLKPVSEEDIVALEALVTSV